MLNLLSSKHLLCQGTDALNAKSCYSYVIRFFYRDGRYLIAGGRSKYLYLWNLESQNLMPLIELPKKITSVKRLQFLPNNFEFEVDNVLK